MIALIQAHHEPHLECSTCGRYRSLLYVAAGGPSNKSCLLCAVESSLGGQLPNAGIRISLYGCDTSGWHKTSVDGVDE